MFDLPSRMIDEGSAVEESELSEQYCVHEWHSGELLQLYLHGEFVLLLLHHEGHLTETETLHFDHDSLSRSWLNSTGENVRDPPLLENPRRSSRAENNVQHGTQHARPKRELCTKCDHLTWLSR